MNPFIFDRPIESGSFCNRPSEVHEIVKNITSHTNMIVIGKRRFGKTTLIKHIINNDLPHNTVSVYVDLFSITSEADFVRLIALAIAKTIATHKSVNQSLESLRQAISILGSRLKFSISFMDVVTLSAELKPSEAKEALEDILNGFSTWLESKKLSAFVVFDEFQQITSVQKKYSIEAKLRSIIQFHKQISYLFMGSRDHIIAAMFSNHSRPFYAQAVPINVGALEKSVYWLWASRLLEKRHITLKEEAIDALFEISAGETRLNNQILHYIYETKQNSTVDAVEIHAISEEIIRSNDAFVRMWFDKFPLAQKKALKIIALNRGKMYTAELMAQYDTERGTISKAIESLIKQDEVAKDNDRLIIKDRINELWIAKIAQQ